MATKRCRHKFAVSERSNILQLDGMGYPLRLCIVTCSKCGKSDQWWLDVGFDELEEIESGKSVLIKWRKNDGH